MLRRRTTLHKYSPTAIHNIHSNVPLFSLPPRMLLGDGDADMRMLLRDVIRMRMPMLLGMGMRMLLGAAPPAFPASMELRRSFRSCWSLSAGWTAGSTALPLSSTGGSASGSCQFHRSLANDYRHPGRHLVVLVFPPRSQLFSFFMSFHRSYSNKHNINIHVFEYA